MKKALLISMITLVSITGYAQFDFQVYEKYTLPGDSLEFLMGHLIKPDLEILHNGKGKLFYGTRGTNGDELDEGKPVNMIIRCLNRNTGKTLDVEIPFNDLAIDLSGFALHYAGKSNYLVFTTGRYHFYLLNLANYSLTGPLGSGLEGPRSDSQDGTLSFTGVFNEGEALLGSAHNHGYFCYNIGNLSMPVLASYRISSNSQGEERVHFLNREGNPFLEIRDGEILELPLSKTE